VKRQRFTPHRLATYLVVAGAFVACSGGERPDWTGTIADSAGVILVTNPTEGLWTPEARWTVEEDLIIGSVEGDTLYQFGSVGGIAVTSDGRIAVLDRQGARISVFTSGGQFERVIGRSGSGPGELGQRSGPLVLARGDTLVVADLGNARMNWYTADGEGAGSVSPPPQGRGLPLRWQSTVTGDIAVQTRAGVVQAQPTDTMDVVTRRTLALEILDTVLVFRSGESFRVNQGAQETTWFAPEPSWVIRSDGAIWFGANQEHRFFLYGPDGALQRIVTGPGERGSLSAEDRALFDEVLEAAWSDAGVPPQFRQRLRDATHYSDRFPAFAQLFIGSGESLWVQRVLRPSELTPGGLRLLHDVGARDGLDHLRGLKSAEWDIYDAEGRYLGILELPRRFEPVQLVGDHLYGVWRDDLDVQHVLRLRLVRP